MIKKLHNHYIFLLTVKKYFIKIFRNLILIFCLLFSSAYLVINYAEAAVGSKWEFKIADAKCSMGGVVDKKETNVILNQYGIEGWEFIGFIGNSCTFVMKRQIR